MNEITMNEQAIEQVVEQAMEQAVEVTAASTPRVNWGKIGTGVLKVGAIAAGVVLIIKGVEYVIGKVNEKKQAEELEPEFEPVVDNVEIAQRDFLD